MFEALAMAMIEREMPINRIAQLFYVFIRSASGMFLITGLHKREKRICHQQPRV
jgi:hypothetical protein